MEASTGIPLGRLYLQIENGTSPQAILGVEPDATATELKDAFRALALRVHPDKAPSAQLSDFHTALFQKVWDAYDTLTKDQDNYPVEAAFVVPKHLPETWESLHARNVAFKEALRRERERALKSKQTADALKAANVEGKNASLARKREERAEKKARDVEKSQEAEAKRKERGGRKFKGGEAESGAVDSVADDWEQEADRLQTQDSEQRGKKSKSKSKPPQNTPTANTSRAMWDTELDERLVSDAEIQGRWDKSLLSGGRSGSVSLALKKAKARSGAAKDLKRTLALTEEASHALKGALTGNRTLSGMVEDNLMREAFIESEKRSEARTDKALRLMDGEVRGQHVLLGQGKGALALDAVQE